MIAIVTQYFRKNDKGMVAKEDLVRDAQDAAGEH